MKFGRRFRIGKLPTARHAAFVLLLMLASVMAQAAQRTAVQVEFRISDQIYAVELGQKTAAAEQAFRQLIVDELRRRIGFLDFTADKQDYRIIVELGDGLRTLTQPIRGIPFRLTLAGPDVAIGQEPRISWVFREQQNSLAPLSRQEKPEDKIRDLELVGLPGSGGATGELRRQFALGDFNGLVAQLLSRVPVAREGALRQGPPNPIWVLPLHRGETCMDLESRFRITHAVQVAGIGAIEMPIEVEVRGPLDTAADAMDAPIIALLPALANPRPDVTSLGSGNVKVTHVYVTLYRRRDLGCAGAVRPTDSQLPGGGAQ
jgi:hypothetical protein